MITDKILLLITYTFHYYPQWLTGSYGQWNVKVNRLYNNGDYTISECKDIDSRIVQDCIDQLEVHPNIIQFTYVRGGTIALTFKRRARGYSG